jgi:predicted PurR-regulated permease PerM
MNLILVERGEMDIRDIRDHLITVGIALRRWILAQAQDAVLVGILWFAGLWILDVPLALLWAILGTLFQFVPQVGTILSLIGPAVTAAFFGSWTQLIYVLVLYAAIAAIDGFVLQPVLMKRNAKVPVWLSILAPLLLGIFFNIWGILLAPPLLAVVYTFREKRKKGSLYPEKAGRKS